MSELIVKYPNRAPDHFPLGRLRITIGRSARNDLCIPDPFASRVHAEVRDAELGDGERLVHGGFGRLPGHAEDQIRRNPRNLCGERFPHRSIAMASLRMLARVLHDEAQPLDVRVHLLSIDSPVRGEQATAHECPE